MFGLKIVKKSEYSDLDSQVKILQNIAADKDLEISRLNSVISGLHEQIKKLEAELTSPKKKSSDVVLLTDVAETPLAVETAAPKRVRKAVKKKTTATTRKKVVRKSETAQ